MTKHKPKEKKFNCLHNYAVWKLDVFQLSFKLHSLKDKQFYALSQ